MSGKVQGGSALLENRGLRANPGGGGSCCWASRGRWSMERAGNHQGDLKEARTTGVPSRELCMGVGFVRFLSR